MEEFFLSTIGKPIPERRALAERVMRQHKAAHTDGRTPDALSNALLAAAFGSLARGATPSESLSQRYGSRSNQVIVALRTQVPDAPWPKLLEGVWHHEVVRRGGTFGAALLQASLATGNLLLREAAEQMPDSPAAPFAHAVVQWSMDPAQYKDSARKLIDVAIQRADAQGGRPLADAVGQHARSLRDLAQGGDTVALQKRALSIM